MDAVKKAYGLSEVIKLASNENPMGASPKVREAIIESLAEGHIYPDGYCTALRGAIAKRFDIPEDTLVFGAGSDEVIAMLGKIFIEPGDECITAAVTFPQYATAVESMGGKMVYAPMTQDFDCPLASMLDLITDKTKMIFVANPNNPTGLYHTAAQQDAFMAAVPARVTVVFDEAYEEYITVSDYPSTLKTLRDYPNAILLKTFSKIYGLASLRVGYGVMNPQTVQQIEKLRCPFNVTTQAQAAAVAALGDTDFVAKSRDENRRVMDLTVAMLSQKGIPSLPSQANFIAANIGKPSNETFERLMAKGYIVRSGLALGFPDGYQRVTIGTEEQMRGFVKALDEI
jgi:histidinol-phosphate aminotransferase